MDSFLRSFVWSGRYLALNLKMETARSSETLVTIYQTIRRHMLECSLHSQCRKNPISRSLVLSHINPVHVLTHCFLRFLLISLSNLHISLPCMFFPSSSALVIFPTHATYSVRLIFDSFTQAIYGENTIHEDLHYTFFSVLLFLYLNYCQTFSSVETTPATRRRINRHNESVAVVC
jgi:hypothetical protein